MTKTKRVVVQQSTAVVAQEEVVQVALAKAAAKADRIAANADRITARDAWLFLSPEEKKAAREIKRANRPNPAPRMARNLTRLVKRVDRMISLFDAQEHSDVCGALSLVKFNLTTAAEGIADLPENWKPVDRARRVGGSGRFEAGMFVKIVEKRRESFAGLLDADEMLELRVVKVVGKKLVLQTEGGVKIVLPTNVIAAAAAQA